MCCNSITGYETGAKSGIDSKSYLKVFVMNSKYGRHLGLRLFLAPAAMFGFGLSACGAPPTSEEAASQPEAHTLADLDDILADPIKRSDMIVKVMGSTAEEDTYAFLKFHVYGYAGENVIPFFTMNNVIVQKWTPLEPGYYALRHYEVAYIAREYTPDGIIAPGIAPNPLNISVIGDRVFIPTASTDKVFNPMSTPDWGEYAGDPDIYWDSMLTYSADIEDVLNPDVSSAGAEIHMQNLVSWNSFFKMGTRPGRTMVRAFGTHLDSLDDIPPEARAGLKKYTPEIFNTDEWQDVRIDAVEFMIDIRSKIDSGEIVVEAAE